MKVWRICKSKFAASAFTGEGAYLFQGRWNPAGVRMVYTSISLSLASVEFFVHLDPTVAPDDLVSTAAILPAGKNIISRISIADLPVNWRTTDNPALQHIGATWVASKSFLALEVPSIAIEGEWNILLNPTHPDFAKITLDLPKPFHFDDRMFKPKR
jgi:RES domain-containing protein